MNVDAVTSILEENARRIEALLGGISDQAAGWKPGPESWSLLEVINHLLDEEREDFRVRLRLILFDPEADWPPIDPAGWVISRAYNARQLEPSLRNFLEEREKSVAWLEGLGAVDLEVEKHSPFGSMRAGDMLTAWLTHDHHHMRQIVELQRALVLKKMSPYQGDYAGEW